MNKSIDYIALSRKRKTRIFKALFMFFDAILPDCHWGKVGMMANKIRIFFARGVSKNIDYKISLHKGADIYPGLTIEPYVFVGRNVSFDWGVTIKSGTKIGKYTSFVTQNWYRDSESLKMVGISDIKPIVVGCNCWIGEKSEILPGVNIGDYTTVGASSVVTKSIQSYCVAVGNPAIVKKHIK